MVAILKEDDLLDPETDFQDIQFQSFKYYQDSSQMGIAHAESIIFISSAGTLKILKHRDSTEPMLDIFENLKDYLV